MRINYRAGYPLGPDSEMDDFWARVVAYYATALLGREMCDCGNMGKFALRWQEDLAVNLEGKNYQTGKHTLDNPFGTERGAIFAYGRVRQHKKGRGMAI